jgi:hypothetical protein
LYWLRCFYALPTPATWADLRASGLDLAGAFALQLGDYPEGRRLRLFVRVLQPKKATRVKEPVVTPGFLYWLHLGWILCLRYLEQLFRGLVRFFYTDHSELDV